MQLMLNSLDDVLILMQMFQMIICQFARLLYLDIILHIFGRLIDVNLDTLCLSLLIDFVDVLISIYVCVDVIRREMGKRGQGRDMKKVI